MTIFYFTSTGNSLAVAKRIGGDLISIPQIINNENLFYKDEAIGIIFPIYGFAAPEIVSRFLSKTKFETDYLFAIGTYGNLPGACMTTIQKQAMKYGYNFDYTNHLLMVDNYLPMFEIGKQIEMLPQKKTEEMTQRIVDDINKRVRNLKTVSLGWRIISPLVSGLGLATDNKLAQKFIVNEKCTNCGICEKVCPVKNITITDKVSFNDNCLCCLGCLHLCPQNALHSKKEKSNKRWRNPEVSLNEIIEANKQQ
jgi:ferredoxin